MFVLATWRVTHLLAREGGPADLKVRFRVHLGSGIIGKLMDCFHCLSRWVAAPMVFFVSRRPLDLLLTWLALSGAACLLERIGQQPVVIEPISERYLNIAVISQCLCSAGETQLEFSGFSEKLKVKPFTEHLQC